MLRYGRDMPWMWHGHEFHTQKVTYQIRYVSYLAVSGYHKAEVYLMQGATLIILPHDQLKFWALGSFAHTLRKRKVETDWHVFTLYQEHHVMEKTEEERPAAMNAFDLISLSRGLNLGNLFEIEQVHLVFFFILFFFPLFLASLHCFKRWRLVPFDIIMGLDMKEMSLL